METRNFYILVASISVALLCFWLTVYAIITLDVDLFQDPNTITIRGDGVKGQVSFSLTELKSDKYQQIKDRTFEFINSWETHYTDVYSGVSLWSLLSVEDLLSKDPSVLTFYFRARDAYHSPKPLNLTIAENNPELVIIAYEEDSYPLFEEGPLRSIVDQSVMPAGEYASQYAVQMLSIIEIN